MLPGRRPSNGTRVRCDAIELAVLGNLAGKNWRGTAKLTGARQLLAISPAGHAFRSRGGILGPGTLMTTKAQCAKE